MAPASHLTTASMSSFTIWNPIFLNTLNGISHVHYTDGTDLLYIEGVPIGFLLGDTPGGWVVVQVDQPGHKVRHYFRHLH